MKVEAHWSGRYPNLCSGEWALRVNGKDYSRLLKDRTEMETEGDYSQWRFTKDWEEEWHTVHCGLPCSEWRKENADWLRKIPCDEKDRTEMEEAVFEAIRAEDFIHGECGGCI